MKWVTRERPKIDRIACPWLIARFVDETPEFLYVPSDQVLAVAQAQGAIPYDIPGVELSHVGEKCSFDAFLAKYGLGADPALQQLAEIVRGADTSRLDLTPQSGGLFAISLGLSAIFADDHEMLSHGLTMYDALYAWCRSCQGETHNWPPAGFALSLRRASVLSAVAVPVMQVGIVRMGMDQPGMGMVVDVRFAPRVVGAVLVLVVRVVHMGMRVHQGVMGMFVIVPLDEMKIEADRHQHGRCDQPGSHWLTEHGERKQRADERGGREIGAGARGAEMAQRQHE